MTKGLKSTLGIGSGKSQEQKNGEVAMAIFNNLRSRIPDNDQPQISFASGEKEALGYRFTVTKLMNLCAKGINQKKDELSLIISENEKSTLNSFLDEYRNSDTTFLQPEKRYLKKLIDDIKLNHKELICRGSESYKKNYFDSFLSELENSIVLEKTASLPKKKPSTNPTNNPKKVTSRIKSGSENDKVTGGRK